jgi:hypothetical protein
MVLRGCLSIAIMLVQVLEMTVATRVALLLGLRRLDFAHLALHFQSTNQWLFLVGVPFVTHAKKTFTNGGILKGDKAKAARPTRLKIKHDYRVNECSELSEKVAKLFFRDYEIRNEDYRE